MKTDSLLVIIVTYNPMKWIDRCLSSLKNSTYPADIFVVDNGSTDGGQEYIKKNYPNIIFRQSTENLGFGKANNLGLQYALDNGYNYVYLLNQDAWVMSDTFEKLITVQKEFPEYGILSPMQIEKNKQYFDSKFRNLALYRLKHTPLLIDDLFFNKLKKIYTIDFVMAAHWLISAECLRIIGGFSPTFPHYGEDNNYIHRVYYKRMKVGIVPEAIAVHDRENRKETKEKKMYQLYINWLIKLSNPILNSTSNIPRIAKTSMSQSIKLHSFQPIRFFFKILCNYPQIIKNKNTTMRGNCAFLKN